LSDTAYEAVKYAEADRTSMNSWIESVLDGEDMRRRCEAHGRWMRENYRATQVGPDGTSTPDRRPGAHRCQQHVVQDPGDTGHTPTRVRCG